MSHKIAVVTSTTRPTRSGDAVAEWFLSQAKHPELEFEIVNIAEESLPFLNEPESPSSGNYQHEHTKKWAEKIAGFDGFVFVVTEYNSGYPAPLKNALDTIYAEWNQKPVAFVGYGSTGAQHAVSQLVLICAKLGMMPLVRSGQGVKINAIWDAFDKNGQLKPEHISGSVQKTVDALADWTKALKTLRG